MDAEQTASPAPGYKQTKLRVARRERRMSERIVVVGSVNLDLVCAVKKIPAAGETVWGDTFQQFPGGKGANQAVAAGKLGAAVSMVAKVGDDDFGTTLLRSLREGGVRVDTVEVAAGSSSGVALISVDAAGQNSIVVIPGANAKLRPEDLERCLPLLQSAGILLVQLETPLETVEYLSVMAKRLGVPLMLDPAPARELPRSLLENVTYLTPNETETCTLCGLAPEDLTLDSVASIAERLQASGPANVLVKLGQHGVYVRAADGSTAMVPAFRVNAVDTTAAGDAFNGGCAAALVRGATLEEAVQFGIGVAGVAVTRAGAQPAMPTCDEVAQLFEAQGKVMARVLQCSMQAK